MVLQDDSVTLVGLRPLARIGPGTYSSAPAIQALFGISCLVPVLDLWHSSSYVNSLTDFNIDIYVLSIPFFLICPNKGRKAMDFGLVVDLETTGIDPDRDEIIEIGIIEFGVEEGRKPAITNMYSALSQPSQSLSEEIKKLTGLDDEILKGQQIDWELVRSYFDRSALYIAHNSSFDRSFLERVWPDAPLPGQWACSMRHVDWEAHGFRTRSLNYLAADHGFVNAFAHRALFDCATTFRLIEPYFDELLRRCTLKEVRIFAFQAPFEAKDLLKARFYRWDPAKRVWYKDVFEDKLDEERSFLATEVYQGRSLHQEQVAEC